MGENIPKSNPEKEAPKQEKVFLNNFFLYLPGGSRRVACEQALTDPKERRNKIVKEKERFIEAMDKLLQGEFSGIDPKEIFSNMSRSNWLVDTAYYTDETTEEKTEEEKKRLVDEAKALSEDTDSKLVPLFNKLVEMGFDKGLLMQ